VERASISREEEPTVELGESLLPTIFHIHRMACVLLRRTYIPVPKFLIAHISHIASNSVFMSLRGPSK
jgi:hypothetical protein